MNTENMSKEELREYINGLLDKLTADQLKQAIVYLKEILKSQEESE